MAGPHPKTLNVQVFSSPSLLQTEPDIQASVSALFPETAVMQVMGSYSLEFVPIVYVSGSVGGMWFYDVSYIDGELGYQCSFVHWF